MLIENVVFNFYEVGEKGFADIKNECLSHFASRLKDCLTSSNERIRRFWCDFSLTNDGSDVKGSIANYKIFQDLYGSKIKYNTKSIIFEETITNNPESIWNVKQYCMDMYNLEYVEETDEHSGYYRYKPNPSNCIRTYDKCECSVGEDRDNAEEMLRHFYSAFGVGEFPFLTVKIIRLGNKDHYFYTIHR